MVWLLVKKIWLLGLVVCLSYVILAVIDLSFADQSERAGTVIKFISFLMQVLIGVILGVTGYTLREKNLLSRGYEFKRTLAANNQESALSRYLKSDYQT